MLLFSTPGLMPPEHPFWKQQRGRDCRVLHGQPAGYTLYYESGPGRSERRIGHMLCKTRLKVKKAQRVNFKANTFECVNALVTIVTKLGHLDVIYRPNSKKNQYATAPLRELACILESMSLDSAMRSSSETSTSTLITLQVIKARPTWWTCWQRTISPNVCTVSPRAGQTMDLVITRASNVRSSDPGLSDHKAIISLVHVLK